MKCCQIDSKKILVTTKCCFCVPIRKGVIIFAYFNLVISLLSFPLLIFLLVEELTGKVVHEKGHVAPLVHLPVTIAFVVIDVIMTIVLLTGAHKVLSLGLIIIIIFSLILFLIFSLPTLLYYIIIIVVFCIAIIIDLVDVFISLVLIVSLCVKDQRVLEIYYRYSFYVFGSLTVFCVISYFTGQYFMSPTLTLSRCTVAMSILFCTFLPLLVIQGFLNKMVKTEVGTDAE